MITNKVLIFSLLLASLFAISCGEESPQLDPNMTVEEQVNILIEQDEYETALSILESEDQDDPVVIQLREKTHLNYGLHSMNTFDAEQMRTRMNNALVQFTEVLKINPQNSVAREQIEQIMGVYSTLPDRSPDGDVLEGLREVGFDY